MVNKLRVPLVLMVMTILVISLFQLYWLRKNYREEKHLFSVRTNLLFRETILRLQASKLHLDSSINIRVQDKERIISMTNILQDRIRDTSGQKKAEARTRHGRVAARKALHTGRTARVLGC